MVNNKDWLEFFFTWREKTFKERKIIVTVKSEANNEIRRCVKMNSAFNDAANVVLPTQP